MDIPYFMEYINVYMDKLCKGLYVFIQIVFVHTYFTTFYYLYCYLLILLLKTKKVVKDKKTYHEILTIILKVRNSMTQTL